MTCDATFEARACLGLTYYCTNSTLEPHPPTPPHTHEILPQSFHRRRRPSSRPGVISRQRFGGAIHGQLEAQETESEPAAKTQCVDTTIKKRVAKGEEGGDGSSAGG